MLCILDPGSAYHPSGELVGGKIVNVLLKSLVVNERRLGRLGDPARCRKFPSASSPELLGQKGQNENSCNSAPRSPPPPAQSLMRPHVQNRSFVPFISQS